MTAGRALPPTSGFAGDDGAADPRLAATLAHHAAGTASVADVVAALAGTRVLVPVLARLEEAGEAHGLTVDKEASAGIVALQSPDGRTALPVFTGTDQLRRWREDARPVPAESERAAASAVAEGWELLVVDPGGPVTVVVPRPAVRALATGRPWVPAAGRDGVRGDVAAAVTQALDGVTAVRRVVTEPGRSAEVAVVLGLAPGLGRAALDAVLQEVDRRLAGVALLADAVDSLELRVVPA